MVRVFLDRYQQRRQLAQFLSAKSKNQVLCVFGAKDAGKTAFLRHAAEEVGRRSLTWTSGLRLFRCSVQGSAPLALISEFISSLSQDRRFEGAFKADRFDKSGAGQRLAAFIASVTKDFSMVETAETVEALLSQGTTPRVVGEILSRTSEWTLLRDYCVETLREKGDEALYLIIDDIDHADHESLQILLSAIYAMRGRHVKLICSVTTDQEFPEHELIDDYFSNSIVDVRLASLSEQEFCQVFGELKAGIAADILRSLHGTIGGEVTHLKTLAQMSELQIEEFVRKNVDLSPGGRPFEEYDGPRLSSDELAKFSTLFAARLAIENDMSLELCRRIDGGQLVDPFSQFSEIVQVEQAMAPLVKGHYVTVMQSSVFFERRFLTWIEHYFQTIADRDQAVDVLAIRFCEAMGVELFIDRENLPLQRLVCKAHPDRYLELAAAALNAHPDLDKEFATEISESLIQVLSRPELAERCDQGQLYELVESALHLADRQANFAVSSRLMKHVELDGLNLEATLAGLRALREEGEMGAWPSSEMRALEQSLLKKSISPIDQLQCCTTLAPIYEHRGEYDQIINAYAGADAALRLVEEPNENRIRYILNRGLAEFHGSIISETQAQTAAIDGAEIDEELRDELHAIRTNHAGMGHFYNGDYREALQLFEDSLALTERLGRRTETPLNNIGASLLMLEEPQAAHDRLSEARNLVGIPRYQAQTIILNSSLAIHMLGMTDRAIEMVQPFADGKVESPDPSLPNKFSINLAYFLMNQDAWAEANSYYRGPSLFKYRFKHGEQQRTYKKMLDYTAAKAGFVSGAELEGFDFLFSTPSQGPLFDKPFIVDINSFYVF